MFGGSQSDLQPLTPQDVEDWYHAIEQDPYGWVIEYLGRCIGSARLHRLDLESRSARYAIGILDPSLLGKKLGREATGLVLQFAFGTLQLERIDLRVLAFNQRAIRSYRHSGFKQTSIDELAVEIDGERFDDLIMTLNRSDWLRLSEDGHYPPSVRC